MGARLADRLVASWRLGLGRPALNILVSLADLLPRAVRERLFFIGLGKLLRRAGVKGDDVDKILGLLGGWKSKLAGLVGIGTGLAMIGHSISGEFSFDEITKGLGAISAGLAVMGLAGKADKMTAATLLASPDKQVVADTKTALNITHGSDFKV